MNSRPLFKHLWYDSCQVVCRILCVALFGVRVRGQGQLPREGGVLLISNHQSHLDPVLAGISCSRRMSSLARDTLFRIPILRTVITWLDAIPLDREGIGLAGVKETLRRLKHGDVVLLFPEGTRTFDGRLAPLKPGFCAFARRTRVPVQPMAVAGAFEAWPRWRSWPALATIHIQFGRPLAPEEIASLDDGQLVAEVQSRLAECQRQADACRRRAVRELPALPAVRH
ncbi:MAG TPA: lysophospholipid acyltransferase family protein [Pirellulales bacterium]|jgi:1-acyl-sn-glycerol-3-phosphate acyltransferase|nr:lysophospholipid acyltransferase family protein [Pirellulales bacterium]